ncbi:riboflavin synthase [Agromyces bauzanensis]|uniref:Riboflavin synthase n=1 Tax=Agromyces bauzanensis TaxID=1308924 RepID=A0A917PDA2_9MICO|nr:riboflavin synthase [Agromyces bauzanensis]GGJ71748.1 putative riboflavin synthase alpha chain [Agromyces bauzanensis]
MFTGIIEELGTITRVERSADAARLTVRGPRAVEGVRHGDSISVSGVCLTVVDSDDESFTADVMAQTLAMSTLDDAREELPVNLERAALVGDRLGGHIVQGHIDGTAVVLEVRRGEAWRVIRFSLDEAHAPLVVDKGSVAVDGVSLTVSALGDESHGSWFEVSLIPETLTATTLGKLEVGDRVNLETDIVARHVERMLRLDVHRSLSSSLAGPTAAPTGSLA